MDLESIAFDLALPSPQEKTIEIGLAELFKAAEVPNRDSFRQKNAGE